MVLSGGVAEKSSRRQFSPLVADRSARDSGQMAETHGFDCVRRGFSIIRGQCNDFLS